MKGKKLYVLVFIILIVMALFIGYRKNLSNRIYVKSVIINKADIKKEINLIGEVASRNVRNYYLNDGKPKEIKVEVGQEVKKGDIIATTLAGNVIADNDGIVTTIDEGGFSFASSMNPTVVTQDVNNLKIIVDVNKKDDSEIEIGQSATIIDNLGNLGSGVVSFRNPIAVRGKSITDTESYVKISVDILESIDKFTIGFNNEVNILVGEVKDTIVVPVEAIITEKNNKNFIYVINNNHLERKEITLGLEGESEIEVKDGVTEGEEVVLNPTNTLKEGDKVYRRQ